MADQDPNLDRQDRNVEVPGDTNSADIVDRTGEQMPRQSHDGIDDVNSLPRRSAEGAEAGEASTSVNDEDREQRSRDSDTSAGRHDNPRTGRISDW